MIINIKKIIDIILISAAIAAVVVFADRIIPSRGITAGQEAEGAGIEETSDRDDGTQKSVKEIRTDMVIDESLFMPLKNIFAAAPPAGAGKTWK